MVKKLAAVLVTATALTLASCASTGTVPPGGGGTTNSTPIGNIITDVANYARQLCGYAPAGNVIASIIGSAVPGVMTAAAIGSAICAAFNPPPQFARRGAVRTVRGWVVTPGAVNGVPVR